MSDLVSIVLPVYNGEKYLSESLDSIIAQTYSNWELIIIDDCSTDSTRDIVKSYADKDERVRYYKNEHNLKLPKSLNVGFSLTKGNYLTWTSDDNRFHPNAIEVLVNALKEGKSQFVFTAYTQIDENGNEIDKKVFDKNIIKMIPVRNVVGPSFMYTREVYEKVGDYDTELFLTEDFDYWQRIYASFPIIYKEDNIYDYRLHSASLTDTKNEKVFYRTLSKTITKNRKLYGRFGIKLSYLYYLTLVNDKKLHGEKNTYRVRFTWYKVLYYIVDVIPNSLKRKLFRIIKKIT